MDHFQGAQRRVQAIFSLHRRKTIAKWCLKHYSKAKTLGKASIEKLNVGFNYVSYKVATDESFRMILAALLLVILFSVVVSFTLKRRRNRRQSQTKRQQEQKEKLSEIDSVSQNITHFKPIPKKESSTLTRQDSSSAQTRLATLKSALADAQAELTELKTTVTNLLLSMSQNQASSTAEIAALKTQVENLTARVDSIETDAGQDASLNAVVDSLAQGQLRLERSSQALMAWRAQVAAYDTAHPSATQSELDRVAADVAACNSGLNKLRDSQEKLSSDLYLRFNSAIKDLMQCMAEGRRAASTRAVRCSTNNTLGSISPTSAASSAGSLVFQGAELFPKSCLE